MGSDEFIIRCLNCGTKNRISKENLGKSPLCGRCHAHLDEMIIRCLACGTKNRMPEHRLHERPLCGHCGAPLVVSTVLYTPIEVTDGTFSREVLAYDGGPVLVDCWAPWCNPCRLLVPILDELSSKFAGAVKITKLNVDENPLTASRYHIHSIPTILFFRDGKLLGTMVGLRPREEIEKTILSLMKKN